MSQETEKLRQLSRVELLNRIDDAREELMKFRFQQATGELTDYTQIRQTRRRIARMMTILNEREQMAATEGEE